MAARRDRATPPSGEGAATGTPEVWAAFADLLLHRGQAGGRQQPLDHDDEDLGAARTALHTEVESGDGPFPLLARRARLSPGEVEVLALCAAIESDDERQRIVGHLHGDTARRRLSVQLLAHLVGPDHVGPRAVGPGGGLRRAALARVGGDGPWGAKTVGVADIVSWRLAGAEGPDPHLPVEAEWVTGNGAGADRLLVVTGDDRTRRVQTALAHLGGEAHLLVPPPRAAEQWEAVIRQATVDGLGVILDTVDGLGPEARWWVDRSWHLRWAVSTPVDLEPEVLPRRAWIGRRAPSARAGTAEVEAVAPEAVERGHRFTAEQLRHLRAILPAVEGDIDEAVRRLGGGQLDTLARRIRPARTLDDLVLGDEQVTQLRELIARYRNAHVVHGEWGIGSYPANGISALFAGPPGTGKTAAAEAVAGAVGLDLCIIDLATVVSKYIGETEKNLDRVFDAAAAGNFVLLFDEADALFGKRTEVSDSHDRYANLEIAYLLQRIERFDGMVVLTTNYVGNIDQAFMRRITSSIEFQLPTVDERRRIWRYYLDAGMPLVDGDEAVDVDGLAERFELSPAAIRNATIGAAFLAADEDGSVTMARVERALRRELRKMGRLVDEGAFRT